MNTTSTSPLALYRQAHGLSQQDLADKIKEATHGATDIKGTGTISKWESGRVPAERVLLVERITGIPRHRIRPDLYPADDVKARA